MPLIMKQKVCSVCALPRIKPDSSRGMMMKVGMLSISNELRILGMIQIKDMICYRNKTKTMYEYRSSKNINMNLNFT